MQKIPTQEAMSLRRKPIFGCSITSRAPAACGELVRGYARGKDFVINSPIGLMGTVSLRLNDNGTVRVSHEGDWSQLSEYVTRTLTLLGFGYLGADIEIRSLIPRLSGLASNAALCASAIHAAGLAVGRDLSQRAVAKLVSDGKETDSFFFPEIVHGDPTTGEVNGNLGKPPPLSFIVVDAGTGSGGAGYDPQRARAVRIAHQAKLSGAAALVSSGFRERDSALVAFGATVSAVVNQEVLPKPLLTTLLGGTAEFGGLGVNCAHNGTVLGVMFDPTRVDERRLIWRVFELVGKEAVLGCFPLVSASSS